MNKNLVPVKFLNFISQLLTMFVISVVTIIYSIVLFYYCRGNPIPRFSIYFHFNSIWDLVRHLIDFQYVYVVAEEILFRLPLLYNQDYFWWSLLVFSLIHCKLSLSFKSNIFIFCYTLSDGYLFSLIGFPHSILFHFFHNALYDLHDVTVLFSKKNSRMILDHINMVK